MGWGGRWFIGGRSIFVGFSSISRTRRHGRERAPKLIAAAALVTLRAAGAAENANRWLIG